MSRFVLCLLLACLSAAASAREARMLDANGDGGGTCPEMTAAMEEAQSRAKTRPAQAAPAQRTKAVKPVASGGGDGDAGRVQRPRWHSFLPGMFR